MQNWIEWWSLSAKPCQLVWRFFENFLKCRKPLLNKGFKEFRMFSTRMKWAFANWRIWAKKKQYVSGTAFQLLRYEQLKGLYPYILREIFWAGLKMPSGNLLLFSFDEKRDVYCLTEFGTALEKSKLISWCQFFRMK